MSLALSIPAWPDLHGLARLLLLGLALYVVVLVALTAWRLVRPARRTYGWAVARGVPGDPSELDDPLEYESWTFRSRGRSLPVWDVRGRDENGPTVIVTHGWGSSRLGALARLPCLAGVASRVVLWDMPGHGEAGGVCELAHGEVRDLRELARRVHAESGGPPVFFGWSLGAEITLRALAAGDLDAAGVVLEGAYRRGLTPAWNVLRAAGYPALVNGPAALWAIGLLWGFDPSRRLVDFSPLAERVHAPVLLLHGSADETCPIDGARALAGRFADAELFELEGAGHNNIWTAPEHKEAACAAVRRFVSK